MTRPFETDLTPQLLHSIQKGALNYKYKGIELLKDPFDLALYARLIWDIRPKTILEVGSFAGGSALWFADHMRAYGIDGRIYSLDVKQIEVTDPSVTFIEGDARKIEQFFPKDWINNLPRPILFIEDSDHIYETCLGAIRHFRDVIKLGEYLIVEDGIITPMGDENGYGYNGGPAKAIREFLEESPDFQIDTDICDYYGLNLTWACNGYLKKIR